jgi:predicted cupin superfamily sugar epimerase
MANNYSAQQVIKTLNLSPHPEKGYYVESFRDSHLSNGRSHSTCIYYLLEGTSGLSKWHRVLDGTEIWHYYAGAPMQLSLSWDDGKPTRDMILGIDLEKVSCFCL